MMVTTARKYSPVNRTEKAAEIAATPLAIRRNGTGWWVASQSREHTWHWTDGTRCTCPDWQKRQPVGGCKHMVSVRLHQQAQQPVCSHCGEQGSGVGSGPQYVGGHGYQQETLCRDRVACWARWDKQHGLA